MFKESLTYDDVLLVPQYSDIQSRKEVNIGNWLDEKRGLYFSLPVIASPMDTICDEEMARFMANYGGLGIVHRYNTVAQQTDILTLLKDDSVDLSKVGFAIGVTDDYLERALSLVKNGAKILCVDVAHGDHIMMKSALFTLRKELGDEPHIMAGNVATLEGFERLASWGANSIRIGIGGGSICSTRIQTGHGVPSLSSIIECARSGNHEVKLIADGGIKNSGDIVKAIGAGADFAIIGSILAGTDRTPGEVFKEQGQLRKAYRGMASKEAQVDWRGRASSLEGIATSVPYKGSTQDVVDQLKNGISSGFSYTGARTINEFWAKVQFIRQSAASIKESDTHILSRNK